MCELCPPPGVSGSHSGGETTQPLSGGRWVDIVPLISALGDGCPVVCILWTMLLSTPSTMILPTRHHERLGKRMRTA